MKPLLGILDEHLVSRFRIDGYLGGFRLVVHVAHGKLVAGFGINVHVQLLAGFRIKNCVLGVVLERSFGVQHTLVRGKRERVIGEMVYRRSCTASRRLRSNDSRSAGIRFDGSTS